jgi:DNA-binding response OmpR family regulator
VSDESTATILVVDDVPANIGLLLDALGAAGFKVLVAESGESALAQLVHGWPDAILLDYRLPGLDGLEVCQRIREMDGAADVPILFLTAVDDVEEKVRVLDAGAVDYVTKPIQPAEVLARLRTHLRIAALKRSLAERQRALEAELAMREEAEELLRDSLNRALIVADQTGKIRFATRLAQTLLTRHFPDTPRDRLPEALGREAAPSPGLRLRQFAAAGVDLRVLELHSPDHGGPGALLALGLTPREAEVLYWLAEGKTNSEIATILDSSRRTVEKHVEHILKKLGVENRATAARVAGERLTEGPERTGW